MSTWLKSWLISIVLIKSLRNHNLICLYQRPYNGVDGLAIMHDAEVNPGSGGPLLISKEMLLN